MKLQLIGLSCLLLIATSVAMASPDLARHVVNMVGGDTLEVTCNGTLDIVVIERRRAEGSCVAFTPTATIVQTNTATVTATPTLTATVTATRTLTVTPTIIQPTVMPTGTPGPILIEGVPLCNNHDSYTWHLLVRYDASGNINCTYGHEHHDDPNTVADIFGPVGNWFGQAGQAISYPWQTFVFATPPDQQYPMPMPPTDVSLMENVAKHYGYKWYVKRDLPCIPFRTDPPDNGCFRAYRVQTHSAGHAGDITARFHSFSLEALVDYGGQMGIVRGGGWMDIGKLVLISGNSGVHCPDLPTNPPSYQCNLSNGARGHPGTHMPAPLTDHNLPGALNNWYAAHLSGVQVGPAVEDWGPTSAQQPFDQFYWPSQHRANNSRGKIENMSVSTRALELRGNIVNGTLTGTWYKDRHGRSVQNCTTIGLDCIPLALESAPAPFGYQMNFNTNSSVFSHADYDVASPVTGGSLIRYPN